MYIFVEIKKIFQYTELEMCIKLVPHGLYKASKQRSKLKLASGALITLGLNRALSHLAEGVSGRTTHMLSFGNNFLHPRANINDRTFIRLNVQIE